MVVIVPDPPGSADTLGLPYLRVLLSRAGLTLTSCALSFAESLFRIPAAGRHVLYTASQYNIVAGLYTVQCTSVYRALINRNSVI